MDQIITEIGVRNSRCSAARGGDGSNGSALLEGNELVEVMEIREHLRARAAQRVRGGKRRKACSDIFRTV